MKEISYPDLRNIHIFFKPKGKVELLVKNPPANAGNERDTGSVLGLGKFPGEGNGNLL